MLNCFVAPLIYHPVERHMLHGPNKMAAKPEARLLLPVPAQRESFDISEFKPTLNSVLYGKTYWQVIK